jgi:hypothetical protein
MDAYRLFNTVSDWLAWVVLGGTVCSYIKVRRELDQLKKCLGAGRQEVEKKHQEVVRADR